MAKDIRNFRTGNFLIRRDPNNSASRDTFAYVDPATLLRLKRPDLTEKFAARLRGEHVEIYSVRGEPDVDEGNHKAPRRGRAVRARAVPGVPEILERAEADGS